MNDEATVQTMKIQTSRFGEVTVPEDALLVFPSGLVGLPQHTRYVVFDVENDSGYQWLQSLDDSTLAVVIVPVELINPDFKVQMPVENLVELELGTDDPVAVSVIITIPKGNPEQATANLRAPLIVNLKNRKAKQVILQESIPLHFRLNESDNTCAEEMTERMPESMHA